MPETRDKLLAVVAPNLPATDAMRSAKPVTNYDPTDVYAYDVELSLEDLEALLPIAEANNLAVEQIRFGLEFDKRRRPGRRGRRQPDFSYLLPDPQRWRLR